VPADAAHDVAKKEKAAAQLDERPPLFAWCFSKSGGIKEGKQAALVVEWIACLGLHVVTF
jgi:hypothetical protein